MNIIWSAIIVITIIYMVFCGNIADFTSILYSGAEDAVQLCISLLCIMALWGGFMEIAEQSNVTGAFSKVLSPIINKLFPKVKGAKTKSAISMNITANILGLGNAATPLGIEAMKRLSSENDNKFIASDSMITFVVLNTASIQLVPVTTAALRAKFGSAEPMIIMAPVLMASLCALIVGLISERLLRGVKKYRI